MISTPPGARDSGSELRWAAHHIQHQYTFDSNFGFWMIDIKDINGKHTKKTGEHIMFSTDILNNLTLLDKYSQVEFDVIH